MSRSLRAEKKLGIGKKWGDRWGSNPRQPESQSGALPTELRPPQKKKPQFIGDDPSSSIKSLGMSAFMLRSVRGGLQILRVVR